MGQRDDTLRVDATGQVHPVGRSASRELRDRTGEWRLVPSAREVVLMRPPMPSAVLKLSGEIRVPGALCDIVAVIAQSSWNGELDVFSDGTTRTLFFDGGNVISAQTTVPNERIGEVLYRFGVLSREQVESIVKTSAQTGKRLGEAAIEQGLISAEQLYPMMARQVEEVFYGALHVSEGYFFFFDRFDEKMIGRRYNLNAGGLLMEGARRMDEMQFFREKIPSANYIPVPIGSGKKVPDEIAHVFIECDGKSDVEEIGRRLGKLEFEVTREIFQLVNAGLVHIKPPSPDGPEAIVDAVNPALEIVHAACDRAGKGAELRQGLSSFATGAGIYDPLFMGAGPSPEGTFKPGRVAQNMAALAGDDPESVLAQLLTDYVGFALFQAESLVAREAHQSLSTQVAAMLKSVQPTVVEPAPPSRTRL